MNVTPAEARRIAALAHLKLDAAELERLTGELNRILEHVVALGDLELSDVPDVGALAGALSTLRGAGAEVPDALVRGPDAMAPDWRDGFFLVPSLPGLSDGAGEGGA